MAHVTEKNVGPQTSKSHDCITCIFLTEKNIFEKNKVYCRTTITNVHPKRPWMCFSDKYYRRKVHALYSRFIRDPAVHVRKAPVHVPFWLTSKTEASESE